MAVPVPKDSSEECRCGRMNNKVHCSTCGSYSTYALTAKVDKVSLPSGEQVTVRIHKCRKCGITFNDVDWMQKCEAPRFEHATMKQRRDAERGMEILQKLAKDREGTLKELFKGKSLPTSNGLGALPGKPQPDADMPKVSEDNEITSFGWKDRFDEGNKG